MDRPVPGASQASHPLEHLTAQERAVYSVLAEHAGRVVSRSEIARAVGIAALNPRRCDALIVGVRRALPRGSLVTVRRRGWMLVDV
jgi:DNA-binding response OmpR family regulator